MNKLNEIRSGRILRRLAPVLAVCLASALFNVTAHGSDLLVSSNTTDKDSIYRYNPHSGKLKKIIDLTSAAINSDGEINPFGVYVGPRR